MKVSLNTVKQYIDIDLPPVGELVSIINQQLGAVEEVIELSPIYQDAKVVRVAECIKHPDADKLSLCQIDAGESELIQVVCGADNVRADMWAVWLPPQSTVPSTYSDKEPFVLSARELRGKMSNGMLASARELALGDDHDGIVEITEGDLPQDKELVAGASFAELFGLNDTIIDIENKMFTHRPDLFGQLGVAREISAILHGSSNQSLPDEDTRFVNPDWYWGLSQFGSGNGKLDLEVFNQAPESSPRFMAVAIDGVQVGASPLWLQCELLRWGAKSINNIVDLTNYIMLLTAQPVHAYDYDKIRGAKIGVRMAHEDEQITLLNGKSYKLTDGDIVIADAEGAIGLAGIMGGGNSEVSSGTTRLILEVANFDMYTVRKSSMRHGLFTDAVTRYNKGQSPLQTSRIMHKLIDLMPGEQASEVYDLPDQQPSDESTVHGEVLVSAEFINERLGLNLTDTEIGSVLRRVNMAVSPAENNDGTLSITAPYWRTDIELPEDIVEEVGRLYGFDKLPRTLPTRSMRPAPVSTSRLVKQAIRNSLTTSGANEVLTYSFVHERIIAGAKQDPSKAFSLSNALSPDLQHYRLSILPSLLDKVHSNIKSGNDEFMLYELGKAHHKDELGEDNLPREFERLVAVYARKKPTEGAPYYAAKRLFEQLVQDFGVRQAIRYQKLSEFDFGEHDALRQLAAPFEPSRSSMVFYGDRFGGVVGEFKQSVAASFKLPQHSAGFELFLSLFTNLHAVGRSYVPLSRFPSVSQDISMRVPDATAYQDVHEDLLKALNSQAEGLSLSLDPLSIYKQDQQASEKTITLRLTVTSYDSTLRDDAVSKLISASFTQIADKHRAAII